MHCRLLDKSVVLPYVPSSQGSAADAPIGQYVPASHCLHPVAPRSFWKKPASQSWHSGLPSASAKLPGRQLVQALALVLPGTGLAFPAPQAMHAALLDMPSIALNEPASHSTKTLADAAPAVGQKPPLGHGAQLLDPTLALYDPGWHAAQDIAPGLGLNEPRSHVEHEILPLKSEYVPGPQGVQAVPKTG